MHSKRGFLGKVFSEGEMLVISDSKQVEKQLEVEEQSLIKIDPSFGTINNTVGIPIESKIEDKVVGVLQLYNVIKPDKDQSLESYIESKNDVINSFIEYIANLILQNEKQRHIMRTQEIQKVLLDA